jgi:hypothetical protein
VKVAIGSGDGRGDADGSGWLEVAIGKEVVGAGPDGYIGVAYICKYSAGAWGATAVAAATTQEEWPKPRCCKRRQQSQARASEI